MRHATRRPSGGKTVPEHERRARGQIQAKFRADAATLEALAALQRYRAETVGAAEGTRDATLRALILAEARDLGLTHE